MKAINNKADNEEIESNIGNINLGAIYERSRFIQPYNLFNKITRTLPSKKAYHNINWEKLSLSLQEIYPSMKKTIIQSEDWEVKSKTYSYRTSLIPFQKNLFIYFCPYTKSVEIIYNNSTSRENMEELKKVILSHTEAAEPMNDRIFLLCHHNNRGLELQRFEVTLGKIDISKNYNDDFIPVNDQIRSRLNMNNDKGIVLLHGKPGTGKTTYIRYLTSVINKRMIYIPTNMADRIASPEFIPLLMNYPDSVIIIEDAENVLEERSSNHSASIANILNLSDGLLSDCLHIQMICSFNTGLSKVDKALLRKGRVIASHEFRPLCIEKSAALSVELGFNNNISSEMTLAEIYNQNENDYNNSQLKKIGFN